MCIQVRGWGWAEKEKEGRAERNGEKERRGVEKRGRKAQRGVESELHRHRSAGSVVTGTESLVFLTQGRTPPPPLLRELTCPSSWPCFIFPTQRCLSASWALSTLILFLFILMENHEVLSGPQYNLGLLVVFRRRNLGVWWGVSERAFSKPHEILCRTVSSVGAVGGGGGSPIWGGSTRILRAHGRALCPAVHFTFPINQTQLLLHSQEMKAVIGDKVGDFLMENTISLWREQNLRYKADTLALGHWGLPLTGGDGGWPGSRRGYWFSF